MGRGCSGGGPAEAESFLVECLAWGLLRAYGIGEPPVPVRMMIKRPLPIFEHLAFLELKMGLYDATYRSLLSGSQLIVVDLTRPHAVQRASLARELYVAFCHSPRAAELHWPGQEHPYVCSNFFARCLLMPAAWMRQACAEAISLEDLVARFDVPTQMVTQRLSEMGCRILDLAAALSAHSAPAQDAEG
jgi:hypothetical protein